MNDKRRERKSRQSLYSPKDDQRVTSSPSPSPLVIITKWLLSPRSKVKEEGEENMALRDRYSSSGSEANLIGENEPDDNFEDEPDLCLDEEEEIELALSAPSDDQ